MTGAANKHTVRLLSAVASAWLVGATGGLAVISAGTRVFAFCGALVAFVCVALWNVAPPRKGRWREGPYPTLQPEDVLAIMQRYRLRWLAALTIVVTLISAFNAVSFADTVLAVTGEPVTAHLVRSEQSLNGYVECTLGLADGSTIPGSLSVEGAECPQQPEVLVDPFGLLDPVLHTEGMWGLTVLSLALLAAALALCWPATATR